MYVYYYIGTSRMANKEVKMEDKEDKSMNMYIAKLHT